MRFSALLVVMSVVGLVGGCSGDEGGGAVSPAPSATSGSRNDPVLSQVAAELKSILESEHRDVYSGMELHHERRELVVYRIPKSGFDDTVRARSQGISLEMRDSVMSLVDMLGLVDRIMDERDGWNARGVGITTAGPKIDGSAVRVTVSGDNVADCQKLLTERYGTGRIVVETLDIAQVPTTGPR